MTIYDVFTAAEAAEIWGIPKVTIRQACSGQKGGPPRFADGEFRKTASQKGDYLISREGMERLYGPMPIK